MRHSRRMWLSVLLICWASPALGQAFDAVGTRAQGMGGAFVGMADDASAVYWNPAGLAQGAFFSLLLDGGTAQGTPGEVAGRRSDWMVALSTPALGLSYYRLRSTTVEPSRGGQQSDTFLVDSLVTHHAGVTLVQSLADGVAVGVTAKLIRGSAASASTTADRAEDLLDGWDLMGRNSNELDLDVGVKATGAFGAIALTVRNVTEPTFTTGRESELRLERQVRGGASVLLLPEWKLAADVDFTTTRGPLGDVRQVAVGSEAQVTRRFAARGGLRLNTAGDRGRTPAFSVGASFAALSSLFLDAQATAGSDDTLRGWGIAGRIVF